MSQQPLTPFGAALAGALGAVFSNALVYPLDTVKTRLQALPVSALDGPSEYGTLPGPNSGAPRRTHTLPSSVLRLLSRKVKRWQMLNMLVRIIRTEGVSGAFKGFSANMINTFSQQFAYFFFHTFLRSAALARRRDSGSLSTSSELALGAAAGALAQIFTIPVAVIATRQQLYIPPEGSKPGDASSYAPSLIETAREVISEGGVTALWTGLRPGLVLTANPAITYGVFERAKTWVLSGQRESGKLGVAEAFWIGVASKTLATIVTYPYIFAKVRLQAKPSVERQVEVGKSYAEVAALPPSEDSAAVTEDRQQVKGEPRRPTGAIELLRKVYTEHGFAGWYQGMGAQIVKAVLCQGILFVSKDAFEVYARALLVFVSRIRSQTFHSGSKL